MEFIISMILLLVGVFVLVVLHACIVGRVFRGDFQEGDERIGRRNKKEEKKITNEELKKLPCFDYRETEKKVSDVDCAVCLENFKNGDKCRFLPNCEHSFHVHCIDSWLLKTPICPICRTSVNVLENKEIEVSGDSLV